jgi:hypothetical protein
MIENLNINNNNASSNKTQNNRQPSTYNDYNLTRQSNKLKEPLFKDVTKLVNNPPKLKDSIEAE